MKTVAAYIKELLYTHECVIVPNLGGFVTNYKPAQISDDGKFIYPPTKQLGFNSKLIINDGLLINTILNNENTTYEQAKQKVDEFVKNVFLSIDNGKKYTIKNVGQLYFDNNLNLIFAPCEKENFNIDTFGLDPINVPGNVDLAIKQKQQTKNILLSRKAKLVYLSLPLIIMLSIIGVNKINTNKNINFSSFTDVVSTTISDSVSFLERKIDSLTKKEYALYYSEKQNNKDANEKKQIIKQKLQTTTIQNKSEIPELVSELKQENEKNKQQTELKKIKQKQTEKSNNEILAKTEIKTKKHIKKYHLIAGSFKTKTRAEKQIKYLKKKGLNPELIISGKKFRISIGGYTKKTQAKQKVQEFKKQYKISSWVLFY